MRLRRRTLVAISLPAILATNCDGTGGTEAPTTASGSPSSTSSATSNNAQSASSSSTGGQGGEPSTGGHCVDPQAVLVDGYDTGLDACAAGQMRRRADLVCVDSYPDPNAAHCQPCAPDELCTLKNFGQGLPVKWTCIASCHSDADCAIGQLCRCGDPSGLCVDATCRTDADCLPGEECTSFEDCSAGSFACTTPTDTCGGYLDCAADPAGKVSCTIQADGHRECSYACSGP